ncbi:kelch repeat-containing protein [Chengkuizengella sediminis]|uniref:Kelch repeat-containing protein n=1 Tax=Chengkuizengella sediminis TaxID=1885917 RepID=UPI0013895EBE|nr:kelch repeat-containing protein [Chengkuizengella sediminis]NDI37236.1 hypothetical protein [Chengkuizengella sediminis]
MIKRQKKWLYLSLIFIICFTIFPNSNINTNANETDGWIEVDSMNYPRSSFQSEVIDGKIYVMGGYNKHSDIVTNRVEVYNPDTNTWTYIENMNVARHSFNSEVIDGKIYVMGGQGVYSTDVLDSVEMYDPSTNTWTQLTSMNDTRTKFQTEVIDGKIYALGGVDDDGNVLGTVEVYDSLINVWDYKASLYNPRERFQSEVVNGTLIVIGGYRTDQVEMYSFSRDEWDFVRDLKHKKYDFQSEIIDNKLYVIGGNGDFTSENVEYWDLSYSSPVWVLASSMESDNRQYFQSEIVNHNIYVIGGSDHRFLDSVKIFDPDTDVWQKGPSLNVDRHGHQSQVVDGSIYVMGGYNVDKKTLTSVEKYTVLPNTPKNLMSFTEDLKVQLAWNMVGNADEYVVKRSETLGGPYEIIADNVEETSFTDSSVGVGITYYYVVASKTESGESGHTNEVSSQVNSAPISISPGYVDSEELVEGALIDLNWETLRHQSAFQVQIMNELDEIVYDSDWIQAENVWYTIPEEVLQRNQVYSWKVRAQDEFDGISPYSEERLIKINSLPELTITSHTDEQQEDQNNVAFTWDYSDLDPQEQVGYQVIGSQDNWETWSYNSGDISSASMTHTTTYLVGGEWDFAIKVFDGMEWSEWRYINNIHLPTTYEPNDDVATAFPISYQSTYSTMISSALDVDFYSFESDQTGIHYVSLIEPSDVNYELYIYNSDMELVEELTTFNEEYFLTESGQTYYLKVISSDGSFSEEPYSFTVYPLELNIETQYQYDDNGNLTNKQKTIKN